MKNLPSISSSDDEETAIDTVDLPQVPISELRPTQMTIGKLQAEMKARVWGLEDKDKEVFERNKELKRNVETTIGKRIVPVVRGADENGRAKYYLIDNHHFVYALY